METIQELSGKLADGSKTAVALAEESLQPCPRMKDIVIIADNHIGITAFFKTAGIDMNPRHIGTGQRMHRIQRFAMCDFRFDINANDFRCELAGNRSG